VMGQVALGLYNQALGVSQPSQARFFSARVRGLAVRREFDRGAFPSAEHRDLCQSIAWTRLTARFGMHLARAWCVKDFSNVRRFSVARKNVALPILPRPMEFRYNPVQRSWRSSFESPIFKDSHPVSLDLHRSEQCPHLLPDLQSS
jgi:hypothetical protein